MPLYDVQCLATGAKYDRFIKLEKFEEPIKCACGSEAKRLISSPLFSVDNTGYSCPVTGKWVGSKREHRENLDRQGCRVLETGEKEINARSRAAIEADFEQRVDNTVEQEISNYSSEKKEKLYNDLQHLDLSVDRQ